MTDDILRLTIPFLWILPLLAALFVQFMIREPRRQRTAAIVVAAVVFAAAFAVFLINGWAADFTRDDLEFGTAFMGLHFHMAVDGLNAILLPMTAAVARAMSSTWTWSPGEGVLGTWMRWRAFMRPASVTYAAPTARGVWGTSSSSSGSPLSSLMREAG